jgi:hypothetical protein
MLAALASMSVRVVSAPSRIEVVLMAFPLIAVLLLPFDCLRRRARRWRKRRQPDFLEVIGR